MSKAKKAAKPGRTKTFNGTLPRGINASQAVSSVAGVTLRTCSRSFPGSANSADAHKDVSE
ncbi:hypothetical protein XthCFBP4691_20415 [Xanthomonas theicola]|uniref:Uncharacterized protein n=1 Tax=Xanthomonas theicola TaxID=56464 RepID=A0A2S6YZ64_9XANT|nr:hypothetical protein XthCFBP4691_20415 [Xanthomonas theicola]